ncbi:MAG: polysaccharide biosynthesis protein, partial [Bacteroidota bacterium]
DVAKKSSVVFRLLSIGNLLNGLNTMPYLMQMAVGWTSLITRVNIIAVSIIVPSLIYITPKYGAIGAASAWVILNVGYILIGIHFMFQKLLRTEKWSWFINDLFIPIIAAGLVAFLFSLLMPIDTSFQFQIIYLSIAATFVFLTASISSLYMRNSFFFMVQYIQGGKWKKNN